MAAHPEIFVRWSDDRGASWGNPISLGTTEPGNYIRQLQTQRLGMARDRVFEVFWSFPRRTALTGAYVDVTKAGT